MTLFRQECSNKYGFAANYRTPEKTDCQDSREHVQIKYYLVKI